MERDHSVGSNENSPSMCSEDERLFYQLQKILDADPLIDELGFVHPTQIEDLNRDKEFLTDNEVLSDTYNNALWHKDHKLAISTSAIRFLIKSAKNAYTSSREEYKKITHGTNSDSERLLESKLMKHSKLFLLLNYDDSSVWNIRKLVMSRDLSLSMLRDELQLSALILSYAAKSEQTWSQRRWVIKMMKNRCQTISEVISRESELVETIAEKFKMNYRAWHHRCWLVSYLTKMQIGMELSRSKKWAEIHIADNCVFHFRQRLISKMSYNYLKSDSELVCLCSDEYFRLLEEELLWNETLIKQFVGREALWVHRRFLVQHLAGNLQADICTKNDSLANKFNSLLDAELQLLQFCLQYSCNDFEDDVLQKEFAASYIVWIVKQIGGSDGVEFRNKLLGLGGLRAVISTLCPGKMLVWETLEG